MPAATPAAAAPAAPAPFVIAAAVWNAPEPIERPRFDTLELMPPMFDCIDFSCLFAAATPEGRFPRVLISAASL